MNDAVEYELWLNDLNTTTRIIDKTDIDARTTSFSIFNGTGMVVDLADLKRR